MHELTHAGFRVHLACEEFALACANRLICRFQWRRKQTVFISDVMIEQRLVDARTPCNFVDARSVQSLVGEFSDGGFENLAFREAPLSLAR